MGYTETLWERSLKVAKEKGSQDQFFHMNFLVSQTSRYIKELGDFLSNVKKQKDNGHHPINDLVNSSIDGIVQTIALRKEIETASL